MSSISSADTLRIVSDDKSMQLLNMVTSTLSGDTDLVMASLRITKRQYYLKLDRLIKAGLVIRKRSKYFLSSFGKVIYESLMLMQQAVEDYWRLNVIDSIERLRDHHMPIGERVKIVESDR